MAKKRVNPFERHLEKGVFGLTALVLAGTLVLYLVTSPNTVTIGGREAGPGEVHGIVKEKAHELRLAVKAAKPEQAEVPEWSKAWAQYADGPLKTSNLPETLARVVSWHTPILEVGDVSLRALGSQAVALAEVIRPGRPIVSAGRNLVEQQPIEPLKPAAGRRRVRRPPGGRVGAAAPAGDAGGGLVPLAPAPVVRGGGFRRTGAGADGEREDVNWATVFFTFDRQAQREAFSKARYSPLLKETLFAWPEIQRRSLQGGRWTEWESVQTFEPYARPATPVLEIDPAGRLAAASADALQRFTDTLRGAQPEIMRPDFPLVVSGPRWEIPKIDGIDADLFEAEGDSRFDELLKRWDPNFVPTGEAGGTGQWWIDRSQQMREAEVVRRQEELRERRLAKMSPEEVARFEARESLTEAERLIATKRFAEAQALVEPLTAPNTLIPAGLVQRANDLLDQANAALKLERQRQAGAMNPSGGNTPLPIRGAPVTLFWAHDHTVRPGAVYQYRTRVQIYNVYAGRPEQLAEGADALKVLVAGAWSEPSEPVEIQPDVHFFLSSPSAGGATVRVYKWFMGQWIRDDFPVDIGSKIGGLGKVKVANLDAPTYRTMEVDFMSDYVAVDLDPDRPMTANGAGKRRRPKTTMALIYLDARNELRERLYEDDKNSALKKELERQVFKPSVMRDVREPARAAPAPRPNPRPRR